MAGRALGFGLGAHALGDLSVLQDLGNDLIVACGTEHVPAEKHKIYVIGLGVSGEGGVRVRGEKGIS